MSVNRRIPLPMLGHTRGKRSPVTCHYKCGDACSKPVPNETGNPTFREIAEAAFSRRSLFIGAGAGALTVAFGGSLTGGPGSATASGASTGTLPFTPIGRVPDSAGAVVDTMVVPEGYQWSTIIRWGDPLFDRADVFDPQNQKTAMQARQFGYNNDYLDILRIPHLGQKEALLVCNHEYTNPDLMFPPTTDEETAKEYLRVAMAAHGMSVVHIRRPQVGAPWSYTVGDNYNRRITAHTPFTFDGPAAGSDLLKTKDDPTGTTALGTLGNCAGGTTPWGTVLSGEENFQNYFTAQGTSAEELRYGIGGDESSYGFEKVDPRFDARTADYANEPNRFGWIVEIDPFEPDSTPVKHTALGRFKHEGANIIIGRSGHIAAYMGDDERFDYLYKFVSEGTVRGPWRGAGYQARTRFTKEERDHNKQLLSSGSLYVAKFSGDSPAAEIDGSGTLPADGEFDGTGTWVPLVVNGVSQIPDMTTAEVLVYTRLAADKVGATKMDRCEDVEPSHHNNRVYVACTNNSDRGKPGKEGATEPNPRVNNRDGHVIEIAERRNDPTATTFRWKILLVCGDPTVNASAYFAGFPADKVSPISCPDNLAFDYEGNLWVSTDGQPRSIGLNDGLFKVPLKGSERGHVQQFLAVPTEAETCGPVIHAFENMVYVAVQHPGEDGTYEEPHSFFPDFLRDGETPAAGEFRGPRPSVVQIYPTPAQAPS